MKERPILFSGEMVRAILRDVDPKGQTRRVVKGVALEMLGNGFTPEYVADPGNSAWCPYGKPGDRLWVRETFARCACEQCRAIWPAETPHGILGYRATYGGPSMMIFKPSIFMPRWASRITLEITKVRVERLQDISEEDAIAEGIERIHGAAEGDNRFSYFSDGFHRNFPTGKETFAHLWDSINSKRGFGWDKNPWLWVIEFKKL